MTPDRVDPPVPRRVLVTGASGFIGRALAVRPRDLDAHVIGIDLRPDSARDVRRGSTLDPGAWADALTGVDAVIHAAALVGARTEGIT